ncbi:MAG TPA: IPT/TIG domain-containing protein [Terracidiphilus sp.]|nr:IPT/TIG domain-containing protein [Terracidiphilus sp.]
MNPLQVPISRLKSRIRHMLMVAFSFVAVLPLAAQAPVAKTRTLPGHVLQALGRATRLPHASAMDEEPIQLTLVLNLSDPEGARALKQDIADPDSSNFHRTLSASDYTARFGPSQEAYDAVLAYLEEQGFTLAMGSKNRRTITVNGTRAMAQQAFRVAIDDYQLRDRKFHAVASDPALPGDIAPLVASIFGLSNLARMQPAYSPYPFTPASIATAYNGALTAGGKKNSGGLPPGLDGSGETIALIEFDGFEFSDVKHWLKFAGLPSKLIYQVGEIAVNGGTTPSGCTQTAAKCGTTEALLDIEAALGMAPGAVIHVYDAPPGTDFAGTINTVADDITSGADQGTILSLSWASCEGDVSSSDATSMDSLLSDYATEGLSLFASSGDNGATCIDANGSYSNAAAFPADSASAIAVGGTVPNVDALNGYVSESWWKNSNGAGGYGTSQWIVGPKYQVKYGVTGRSVPDVSMEANPGIVVCQATSTLSPDCGTTSTPGQIWVIGGTSLAAPLWAGTWALAQQAVEDAGGSALGYPKSAANGFLYSIDSAFHKASSMKGTGNNFAHVGLGSPDMTKLIANVVPPRIDSFKPGSGEAKGGTKVTILGAGFIGVTKVRFGSQDGTHLTIYSDTKLTVETPEAPGERATIEVETPGGKANAGPYLYVPEIKKVSPTSGPMEGGASVTVEGHALDDDEKFVFGTASASKVKCPSSTKCTMNTPANAPGTVGVQAQTTWGSGSLITSDSSYAYDALTIDHFTPKIGPTSGGLTVTIYGHSFEDGKTTFWFGSAKAKGVTCPTSDYCYMNNPASSTVGKVQITASVGSTTSAPAKDEFTYEVFPTVTGISQNQAKAGTTVTLTGTAFGTTTGQTTFNFFGIDVDGTCSSTTQCTAVVPANSAGPGVSTAVTVTVDGNTSLDYVTFTNPGKPLPCKGTTCN